MIFPVTDLRGRLAVLAVVARRRRRADDGGQRIERNDGFTRVHLLLEFVIVAQVARAQVAGSLENLINDHARFFRNDIVELHEHIRVGSIAGVAVRHVQVAGAERVGGHRLRRDGSGTERRSEQRVFFVRIVAGEIAVRLVVDEHRLEARGIQRVFRRIIIRADGFGGDDDLIAAVLRLTFVAPAAGDDDAVQTLRGVRGPRGLVTERGVGPENFIAVLIPHDDELLVRTSGGIQIHRNNLAGEIVAVVGGGVDARVGEIEEARADASGVEVARDFFANDGVLRRGQIVAPVFRFHDADARRGDTAAATRAAGFREEQNGFARAGGGELAGWICGGASCGLGIFQADERHEVVRGRIERHGAGVRDVAIMRDDRILEREADDDAVSGIFRGVPVAHDDTGAERIIFFADGIPHGHVRGGAALRPFGDDDLRGREVAAEFGINIRVIHGAERDGVADENGFVKDAVAVIPHHPRGALDVGNGERGVSFCAAARIRRERVGQIAQRTAAGEDGVIAVIPAFELG